MSNQCVITKKTSVVGFNVSHSKRRTRRRVYPNVQKHRLINPATGKYMTITVSAAGLRTLAKWDKAGRIYDLRQFVD